MAIFYPLDFSDFPGWSTEFDPFYRQEIARTAGGLTQVADLGRPLWKASYVSRTLSPNELSQWRGRIQALSGSLQTFQGRDTSRCFPIDDPRGSIIGANYNNIFIDAVTSPGQISLRGLPPGYVISTGDYINTTLADFKRVLFRVTAGNAAASDGKTGMINVGPYFPTGVVAGLRAEIVRPWVLMMISPGTLNINADVRTGRGTVSFQSIEVW